MKRIAFLTVVLLALSQTFACVKAQPSTAKANDLVGASAVVSFVNGRATITKHIAGADIEVVVKTSKTSEGAFKEGFRWGGDGAKAPPTLISSVVVQSGNEALFVPLSAYSDLGDPRQISLKLRPNGFELSIMGGDAGAAYNPMLQFENGRLTRRRVAHGELRVKLK